MYEEFTQNRIAQLRMQDLRTRYVADAGPEQQLYQSDREQESPASFYKVCSISVNTSVSRHSNFLTMAAPIPPSLPIWLRI